jgi:hypothetical protein
VRRWRWVGFGGSALVAAAAYVVGANVGPVPAGQVALSTRPTHLLGLAGWLVGAAALVFSWLAIARAAPRTTPTAATSSKSRPPGATEVATSSELRGSWGGRAGRGASTGWLIATGALWALPLLVAPPLGSRDIFAYACQGAAYAHGLDPYSIGAQASSCRWAAAVPELWRGTPAPYGPLWLPLAAGAASLAGASLWAAVTVLRMLALAGLVLAGWCLHRLARQCGVDPRTALWLGLLSPLVLVHAVSGAHNDALVTGLVLAGLVVAVAGRPATGSRRLLYAAGCGAIFGLALAVKVTAVVAAPFALLLLAPAEAGRPGWAHGSGQPGGAGWAGGASGRGDPGAADWPGADDWLGTAGRISAAGGLGAVGGIGGIDEFGAAGWPSRGGSRRFGLVAVPFIVAALGCYAVLSVATGLGLGWISALGPTTSMVQWTSLPTGLGMAVGYLLRVFGVHNGYATAVSVARWFGTITLGAVLVTLFVRAWLASSTVAILRLTAAALTVTALLSPVFYPWYALTALALWAYCVDSARARTVLASVTVVLVFLVLPDGYGLAVATKLPGALLDVVAVCAAIWYLRHRAARRAADHARGTGPTGGSGRTADRWPGPS